MKSLFEEMGGTYRQEGDYLIPNLALPEEPEYQIGKYGHMRRSYMKEHRPIFYTNLLTNGTLITRLSEYDYEMRIVSTEDKKYTQLSAYATSYIGNYGKRFGYIANSELFNILDK